MVWRLRLVPLLLAGALLTGAAAPRPMGEGAKLDTLARDYVHLTLEAGGREPGYVDAYYGPADWAAQAKAHPRDVATLRADAHALNLAAHAVNVRKLSPLEQRRRAMLIGQLTAAETRQICGWFAAAAQRGYSVAYRRFVSMIDALDDRLVLLDVDGRVLFLNQATDIASRGMHGVPRAELVGQSPSHWRRSQWQEA